MKTFHVVNTFYVVNLTEETVEERSHAWVKEKLKGIEKEHGPALAGDLKDIGDEVAYVVFTDRNLAWDFLCRVKK